MGTVLTITTDSPDPPLVLDRILAELPGDVVIALGEPTHGSANVSAWKFAIIHELAQRGLLATLAFEDPYVAGLEIDAALRSDGDMDAAWDGGSSIWDTITIRAGMRELQKINTARPHEDRVSFLGFDIRRPRQAAAMLVEKGYREHVLIAMSKGEELSAEELDVITALCRRIADVSSGTEAAVADQLRRHVDAYLTEPDLGGLHRRDTHMAEVLLDNLPATGLTIVWAHNEHVARNPDNFGGPSMGKVLHEVLGDRYFPVGILCGDGECRAVDPASGLDEYRSVPLPPVRSHTTEAALLSGGCNFVTGAEFSHPGPRRFIGWRVDTQLFDTAPEEFEVGRPSSDFSALAYLPTSEADSTAGEPSTSALAIDVPGDLLACWREWFAPPLQPFRTDVLPEEIVASLPRRTHAATDEHRDTFFLYGGEWTWLEESEFTALPRFVQRTLLASRRRLMRPKPSPPWPSEFSRREDAALIAWVEAGTRPSRHAEVDHSTWNACEGVLPRAHRLAGTFPTSGSGANCYSTVVAAAGDSTADDLWMQTDDFIRWLDDSTIPIHGTEADALPGTVLTWTEHGTLAHAAVTTGDGWVLNKPSQSWSSARLLWIAHELILGWRFPGTRLTRHQIL